MAQSKITINGTEYQLKILDLEEINNSVIVEKSLIPDSIDYSFPNSVLVTGGNYRKKYTISGYTDLDTSAIFRTTFRNSTLCVTDLYGAGNSSTNLTSSANYIITQYNSTYKLADDTVYYNMELTEIEEITYSGFGYGVGGYGTYGYGL